MSAEVLRDLNRAKVLFQARAISTVLHANPLGAAALSTEASEVPTSEPQLAGASEATHCGDCERKEHCGDTQCPVFA